MDILQELQNRILFCDGGMGSLLQEAGLKPGELPGTWNITHPEELVKIHKSISGSRCRYCDHKHLRGRPVKVQ